MTKYFETTVKYEKVMEDGLNKTVKDKYLINALSYTEAEAKATKEAQGFCEAFEVADIKKAKYAEIFRAQTTDEKKSGKEKKTKHTVLVEADSLSDALKKLNEGIKGTMADYNAVCVKETNIVDVIE